ncbi:hypothetical protein Halha_1143 [Halobacteroides halobius DSM 5150]|uniref:DUF4912 domain-containing protein n=1 Tax=Halobacteroides halobius (strain ATCC 35273 / DSM 5150 / MD-1) TaxID=748449 RepID=L0K727_HALHC|nr:DUF4912 domain-containing protein [Halobacteroides halobius]AGB41092.1 hypothetical protein Halha_1143 [Halobacteroides halobius DSM 5150]
MSEVQEISINQLQQQGEVNSSGGQSSQTVQKKQQEEKKLTKDITSIYQLPNDYQDNKLVLQVKNPQTAYLYWNYNQDQLEHIAKQAGYQNLSQVPFTLKLIELDTANNYHVTVDLKAKQWYLNDLNPGHTYQVKLGLLDRQGNFYTVMTSNRLLQPRNTISNILDKRWMTVEEEVKQIYWLSGVYSTEDYSSSKVANKLKEVDILALSEAELEKNYSSFELY